MASLNKFIIKRLLWSIFLFALTAISVAQTQPDTLLCNKGYVANVNGENCCIDTTNMYYPLYDSIQDNIIDYRLWHKTILMKVFNETQWYNQNHSTKDKMRILFFNLRFDTVFLFSFSAIDINIKTVQLIKKKMPLYVPPSKTPTGITIKEDSQKDSIYCYQHLKYLGMYALLDTVVYSSTQTEIEQKWYMLNYGKIDTVTYTVAQYVIPQKKYAKLQKNIEKLKDYTDAPDMWMDDIIIEYIHNNNYHLIRTAKDASIQFMENKEFRKNMSCLVNWIYKYIY
jgi:hypothetical protein